MKSFCKHCRCRAHYAGLYAKQTRRSAPTNSQKDLPVNFSTGIIGIHGRIYGGFSFSRAAYFLTVFNEQSLR